MTRWLLAPLAIASAACPSFLFGQSTTAMPGITTIQVGSTVLQKSVKPFGINLGQPDFYDSAQMLKNLVGRNPGFEGEIYQSVVRCAAGTSLTCVDDEKFSAWKPGFWKGYKFEVISGAAKGRSGTVADSTASDTKTGATITFDRPGLSISNGDYLILRSSRNERPEAGWWVSGNGIVEPECKDLPPQTTGKQAIRMNTMAPDQSLSLNAYFDKPDRSFIQLNGYYRLTFFAKRVNGSGRIQVRFSRSGSPAFLEKTVDLTNHWQKYFFEFHAQESGSAKGTCELNFVLNHGIIQMDDVSIVPLLGNRENTTAFRDPVWRALRELKPGILRYWAYQLGDTLDNQLAPVFARQRPGYSTYKTEEEEIQYGLPEFLELCEAIHAEPWYVVPIAFSPGEMAGLIEYLQGDAQTVYGARRAAAGRPNPWTDAFPKIHLEFGNEAWNSIFRGGTIEYPAAYGHRANELFRAARAVKGYRADKFDLILGGQEVYIERNREILAAAGEQDTFAVAAYLSGKVDNYSTPEELFGPLFAEVQAADRNGVMQKNASLVRHTSPGKALAVYEMNLGTMEGAISQSALDRYTPSLGAGLAVASHLLTMLRDLGIHDQLLWQLPQFDLGRVDHKTVRLYGAVVDMGVTDRRRPQFLAIQAINEVLAGDLIETRHTGPDPTWDQPLLNGVELKGAHYLQSFAFSHGDSRALVLLNLHRTAKLDVRFAGVNAPAGAVDGARLSANEITDSNEDANHVMLTRSHDPDFAPSHPYSLPPFSLTVLQWHAAPNVTSEGNRSNAH